MAENKTTNIAPVTPYTVEQVLNNFIRIAPVKSLGRVKMLIEAEVWNRMAERIRASKERRYAPRPRQPVDDNAEIDGNVKNESEA